MTQVVTLTEFEQMFPQAPGYFSDFERVLPGSGIITRERAAAFFAQLHHESCGLTRLEESFRYSAGQLTTVFPFRFPTLTLAKAYIELGPQAIANLVYANRMGNGNERSGDGWKFRGRGFIQLTGRNNYADFGSAFSLPLTTTPELAGKPAIAARIAGRFWLTRGCNEKADTLNIRSVTRAINGGLNGINDRTATWQRFRQILGLKELADV